MYELNHNKQHDCTKSNNSVSVRNAPAASEEKEVTERDIVSERSKPVCQKKSTARHAIDGSEK